MVINNLLYTEVKVHLPHRSRRSFPPARSSRDPNIKTTPLVFCNPYQISSQWLESPINPQVQRRFVTTSRKPWSRDTTSTPPPPKKLRKRGNWVVGQNSTMPVLGISKNYSVSRLAFVSPDLFSRTEMGRGRVPSLGGSYTVSYSAT